LVGGISNKRVSTFWPPNFWAGDATGFIEKLLRVAQRCLGAACNFQKSGFKLASGGAFEVIMASCFKCWLLWPVR